MNKYRKRYGFREINVGKQIFFSRLELIQKVLLPENTVVTTSHLILDHCDTDGLETVQNVFDLRGLDRVDEFGAMSLLCLIKGRLRISKDSIYVLARDTSACRYLKAIGFFQELRRGSQDLFVNEDDVRDVAVPPGSILPLQMLGYRGAEKKILDHLYDSLQMQGFSESLCSRLGWTLGELADNAHTHAGGPCFMTIVSRPAPADAPKFLCISVGDIGEGIPNSLRVNPKYNDLNTKEALYWAFKSTVSRWGDEAKRGKGLNDLLTIGKGNRAWVRVETNGQSLFFDFREEPISINNERSASTKTLGTRFSLVLIDAEFKEVSRQEIDRLIDSALEVQQ